MEEGKPLISVIVPIYNVATYLRKCLDSLLNQTMKEIELICIDDGSTDGSGSIADEYAQKSHIERLSIRVIHTENRGLSAARNRGINEARAEWLMFVDSDDWVNKEFCKIPYEAALKNKADLVIFERCIVNERGKIKKEKEKNTTNSIIDQETAIDIGAAAAWNKLYSKQLFETIRFPEGRTYEDFATTHKVVYLAKRIYKCSEILYNYRIRRGSISQSTTSRIDEYLSIVQRYNDLTRLKYPKEKAEILLWKASLAYCGHAADEKETLYKQAEAVVDGIKGVPNRFSKKDTIMLKIWRINRHLYRLIYWILGKRMSLK